MDLTVYTDGGSRGNPGISGFGVVINSPSGPLARISKFTGIKTNNEVEYLALIEALHWIDTHHHQYNFTSADFYSDSQLLVRQIQGIYKVKAPNIKPLYAILTSLLKKISFPCRFHQIPREKNSLADSLANQAMDHPQ